MSHELPSRLADSYCQSDPTEAAKEDQKENSWKWETGNADCLVLSSSSARYGGNVEVGGVGRWYQPCIVEEDEAD